MAYPEFIVKDLIDVRDGTHDSPKYLDKGYPLVTSKNLIDGRLDLINTRFISEEDYNQINNRSKVDVGDILYSMIGSIGNLCLVEEEPSYAIKNVALFKFKDERIWNRYFYYLLSSEIINRQIEKEQRGGTQKFVSLSILRNLSIPLPSLEEQKAIVAKLDRAQRLIDIDKEMLAKYDQLIQSVFLDMFGDPVTNPKGLRERDFGEVVEITGGYAFKSKYFTDDENGIKVVKIANVHFIDLDWSDVQYLPIESLEEHEGFSLRENDILLALTRPIINSLDAVKAVVVKKSDLPSLLNQRVARIRVDSEEVTEEYITSFIYTQYFKREIERYASTSLQPNVSTREVNKIKVLLPPIEQQIKFSQVRQLILKERSALEKNLKKSEDLFSSLVQEVFG